MQDSDDNGNDNRPNTLRIDNCRSQQQLFSKFTRNLNNITLQSLGSFFSAASSRKHPDEDSGKDNQDVDSSLSHTGEHTRTSVGSNASSRSGYSSSDAKTSESTQSSLATDHSLLNVGYMQGYSIWQPTEESSANGLDEETPGVEGTFNVKSRTSLFNQGSRILHSSTLTGQPISNNNELTRITPYHEVSMTSAPPVFVEAFPSPIFDTYRNRSLSSATISSSGGEATPPLSPDPFSFTNNYVTPAIPADSGIFWPLGQHYPFQSSLSSIFEDRTGDGDDDSEAVYLGPYLQEVKEGKKPEQCTDVAVNGDPTSSSAVVDDPDEWYGLEYTLEISSRERHPSNSTRSCSGGEHSKSRESWAAIHQGTIHPFFEDEDYHQWKNWHRFLDHQEERKKHKKGYEFKALSKDRAWLYVDEIRTRDVLYWQKEVYGVVARDVKERLLHIVRRRPDPYFPPHKHNLSWYLKRSRSAACLRELKPIFD